MLYSSLRRVVRLIDVNKKSLNTTVTYPKIHLQYIRKEMRTRLFSIAGRGTGALQDWRNWHIVALHRDTFCQKTQSFKIDIHIRTVEITFSYLLIVWFVCMLAKFRKGGWISFQKKNWDRCDMAQWIDWTFWDVPYTVKPVYNDHLMGYFSAFWSSSRQKLLAIL